MSTYHIGYRNGTVFSIHRSRGGGQEIFFPVWEICMSLRDMRFARGVRGHAPPRKFFKMVQFGAYFDQILSLKNFNNYHFLYKNF